MGGIQSTAPGTVRGIRSTRQGQQNDFETPMPGSASSARIKVRVRDSHHDQWALMVMGYIGHSSV
jgi:hypothetical protein